MWVFQKRIPQQVLLSFAVGASETYERPIPSSEVVQT